MIWVLLIPLQKYESTFSLMLTANFLHQFQLVVFHWSLSYSKSSQDSRTLLNILADLNSAVIWMVSILPLISNSLSQLVSLSPSCSTTFQLSGKIQVFVQHFTFFHFHSMIRRSGKIHEMTSSLLVNTWSGLLTTILWSVCIAKSQRILCVSFSKTVNK